MWRGLEVCGDLLRESRQDLKARSVEGADKIQIICAAIDFQSALNQVQILRYNNHEVIVHLSNLYKIYFDVNPYWIQMTI